MAELISSFELKENLNNPEAECECELLYKLTQQDEYSSISSPKVLPKHMNNMLHTYAEYVTNMSDIDQGKQDLKLAIEETISKRYHLFNYSSLTKVLKNIQDQIDQLNL